MPSRSDHGGRDGGSNSGHAEAPDEDYALLKALGVEDIPGGADERHQITSSLGQFLQAYYGTEPEVLSAGNVIQLTTRYPYKPLSSTNHFRLLKLLPRSTEHPLAHISTHPLVFQTQLRGQIVEDVDLSGEVAYDCLSYTWGTGSRDFSLWLDDFRIGISVNLFRALHSLRLPDEERLVWVDFVCIDQENPTERSQQVGIMYQIFQDAKQVVVDLGGEADRSELVPHLLDEVITAINRFEDPLSFLKHERNYTDVRDQLPPADHKHWKALRSFLVRPWFTRVWIVQEAMAARNLVFLCGNWLLDGPHLIMMIQIASSMGCPCHPGKDRDDGQYLEKSKWVTKDAIGMNQINLMHHLGVHLKETSPDWFRAVSVEREWGLLELLERSRHAQATDPRDKVFAFLNICKERGQIEADYTESVAESYTRVACFFIENGQLSRVLENAASHLTVSTLDVPSWVPDWSLVEMPATNIAPQPSAVQTHNDWFTAGGEDRPVAVIDPTRNGLKVRVSVLDRIKILGNVREHGEDPPPPQALRCTPEERERARRLKSVQRQVFRPFSEHGVFMSVVDILSSDILRERRSDSEVDRETEVAGATSPVIPGLANQPAADHGSRAKDANVAVSNTASQEISATEPLIVSRKIPASSSLRQWPIIWQIFAELALFIMFSKVYTADEKWTILYQSAVCGRNFEQRQRVSEEFSQYADDFHNVLAVRYEPDQEDAWLRMMYAMQKSELLQARRDTGVPIERGEEWSKLVDDYAKIMVKGYANFSHAMKQVVFHLRAAIGEKDLVGQVPQLAEEGDLIVIIQGVSVPMVVRPVTDGEHSGRYRLVGQAYFHGFMEGERMVHPQPKLEEMTLI